MRITRIALVFPLALALGGCTVFERMGFGPQHRLGATTTCAGAMCQVPVSVTEDCVITAGDVDVKTNTTPMVNIVWHLTGGRFTSDGIRIRSGPAGHFGTGHSGGAVFTHQFRNSPKGEKWKFDVKVVVGSRTCVFDPYVMN